MVKRLVVDRDLINAKFETYRYNRDCKYEIHSETIYNRQQIHSFKLNDTDYSYCHATMSSNLNCFYQDRNDPHRVYYITDSGSIIVASPTDPNNSCKFEQFQLFSIPDFNSESMYASISFPSKMSALILVSKKFTRNYLLEKNQDGETEQLEKNDYKIQLIFVKRIIAEFGKSMEDVNLWIMEASIDLDRDSLYSDLNWISASHFHLYDSLKIDNKINIVVGSVNECFVINTLNNDNRGEKPKNRLANRFGAIFHYIQLRIVNLSLTAIEIKQFIDNPRASNEFPKYISFDNEGKDLLIVSSFKMKYKEVNIASIKESTNEIRIQPLIKKEEESSNSLATDSMCKERKETTEAKVTKAIFDEYENFDFQDSEAFMVMVRFDCQSGSIHDEYDLSSQQWLFSMINYSKENRFPILVTRHDVDAFMYVPQIENGELRLKHLESFPAFGYVSVSKRNRRYMTFGPELDQHGNQRWNYGVIDNWTDLHLFVYLIPDTNSTNCGQQFLFYFDKKENSTEKTNFGSFIYGLSSIPKQKTESNWNGMIYILSKGHIHSVQF